MNHKHTQHFDYYEKPQNILMGGAWLGRGDGTSAGGGGCDGGAIEVPYWAWYIYNPKTLCEMHYVDSNQLGVAEKRAQKCIVDILVDRVVLWTLEILVRDERNNKKPLIRWLELDQVAHQISLMTTIKVTFFDQVSRPTALNSFLGNLIFKSFHVYFN